MVVIVDNSIPDAPTPDSLTFRFVNNLENFVVVKRMAPSDMFRLDIDGLVPGFYTISASAEIEEENTLWIYSGHLQGTNIFAQNAQLDTMRVSIARGGSLIFKEIFYGGSRTQGGGSYFRDQFYEIYNNSTSTIYLDGVCIAILEPLLVLSATAARPVWNDPNADDYVFVPHVWQIPGNGTQYPLRSGESAIIAQRALNHQQAGLNPNFPDPMLGSAVNLSGAEFETFVTNVNLPPNGPAIDLVQVAGTPIGMQWLTTINGAAYVLFRPEGPVDRNYTATRDNLTTRFYKVRRSNVLDLVEGITQWTLIAGKRAPMELDAGAVCIEGSYHPGGGRSVARRIRSVRPDGTIVFQDTNNSTEDFEVTERPMIRRHGTGRPEWNTWTD